MITGTNTGAHIFGHICTQHAYITNVRYAIIYSSVYDSNYKTYTRRQNETRDKFGTGNSNYSNRFNLIKSPSTFSESSETDQVTLHILRIISDIFLE